MVETDWRRILSFSQKELSQDEKEALCDSLSWMEADDIELNFGDLKILFKLAQDILKYKSEQHFKKNEWPDKKKSRRNSSVNNMVGEMQVLQRKHDKKRSRKEFLDSPAKCTESNTHQEELIQANQEVLEQLQADIAELEARKNKLEKNETTDRDSESSRDLISEMNEMEHLQHEITIKNRHIRKLLGDIKVLEEENIQLRKKTSVLKEKLTEAALLIENLTDQLHELNSGCKELKEVLGKGEETKALLAMEIDTLKTQLSEKQSENVHFFEEVKAKAQHWKNIAKSKKAEYDALSVENMRLKEDLNYQRSESITSLSKEESQAKELQEKLAEASNSILKSAKLIEFLKSENQQLKATLEQTQDYSLSETKNESDDGKERALILKLRKKVNNLVASLAEANDLLAMREKEMTEVKAELQLFQSGEEGVTALIEGLKGKKRQIKLKDEGIKSLVKEVNTLNNIINDLQMENEVMRQKLNLDPNTKIPKKGILKKYHEIEQNAREMKRELRTMENKLINLEINIHNKSKDITKLSKTLYDIGYDEKRIEEICNNDPNDDEEILPQDGGGEASVILARRSSQDKNIGSVSKIEMQEIVEENEGLRKGLQEILDFLKDNSSSSSGVLSLQCPSLEAVLQSLEARHSAGWFAPHMAAILELRAAIGGRDSLLTALHEARKETFDVMTRLSKEAQKSQELREKLEKIEKCRTVEEINDRAIFDAGEFGTWMAENDQSIDFSDKVQVENLVDNANTKYEYHLKSSLEYFHQKFKEIFDKMTKTAINAADEKNKWSLLEEQYKATIENLKAKLNHFEEDDKSEDSPGAIGYFSSSSSQRKCIFLEEAYKFIRTTNENLKNELLECKREILLQESDYEIKIQQLILSVTDLSDKLRQSISQELFWKQHEAFTDVSLKYRTLVDKSAKINLESKELLILLEQDKIDIMAKIQENESQIALSQVEQTVKEKQLERVCMELEGKNKKISELEVQSLKLQDAQAKLIDTNLSAMTTREVNVIQDELKNLAKENKVLKDQSKHINSQLDIAVTQLQHQQGKQLSNDMEINMLRHQILDLQSTGDNKAIIARLSGENLIAHLQVTETYKKIERLSQAFSKETKRRIEAEEMLERREKIFNIYAHRYESKFRYMYEVMQCLRLQYSGSLPLISIEKFVNNREEYLHKERALAEKLDQIEDLRSDIMIKLSVFDQILDVSKAKCLEEQDSCPHNLKYVVLKGVNAREKDYFTNKIQILEKSQAELVQQCNSLEKSMLLINQGSEKDSLDDIVDRKNENGEFLSINLELEDIQSDDESSSRGSQTITLPKPQVLTTPNNALDMTKHRKEDKIDSLPGSPLKTPIRKERKNVKLEISMQDVLVQTSRMEPIGKNQLIQTEHDGEIETLKTKIKECQIDSDKCNKQYSEALKLARQRADEIMSLSKDKNNLEQLNSNLKQSNTQNIEINTKLQITISELNDKLEELKNQQLVDKKRLNEMADKENKSLLHALEKLESDKTKIIEEYKTLLDTERKEYAKSVKDLNNKILELKVEQERKGSDASHSDAAKEIVNQYSIKIVELEDKCFKLQSHLDGCNSELMTYQSEAERWKDLASERLTKMELLNSKLEERHCQEVESYKAENEHWLSQLNESQRSHLDLRSKLSEQKAIHVKQLAEKDSHIEQLRSIIHGLKNQLMTMQMLMSANDPGFDFTAIVEAEADSEGDASQRGFERLELKFGSMTELQDDMLRLPSSSSAIWQDPVIERLRRDKQLTGKQNSILRRQIKALAARERRSRLEAQNLKSQVYRISTTGSKAATAETASLQGKIASLQAQLTSARRDTQSSVALWDKWKRAQQSADRWQARYEEKCNELKKMETGLSFVKSAVNRLEKEKRVLLARLADYKEDKHSDYEKQDRERSEKTMRDTPDSDFTMSSRLPSHISTQALMDRIQAQQRRIAALELAERGNEPLVAEYERSLAEITALKGQLLILESALLETQIRSPIKSGSDQKPEVDYWKNYSEMLKEENLQLSMKLSSMESTPTTAHQHRINDLEQTILTLRGLVSKLQADQKSSNGTRKMDSRPSSGRSNSIDKGRKHLESYRTEITNLKRSIIDKDNLLERSKEMLKIAAEREDELLRENTFLRRQLSEQNKPTTGFLSA